MLLFGEPMTSAQALQRGFVSHVFPKAEFAQQGTALVEKFAKLPKHASFCSVIIFTWDITKQNTMWFRVCSLRKNSVEDSNGVVRCWPFTTKSMTFWRTSWLMRERLSSFSRDSRKRRFEFHWILFAKVSMFVPINQSRLSISQHY